MEYSGLELCQFLIVQHHNTYTYIYIYIYIYTNTNFITGYLFTTHIFMYIISQHYKLCTTFYSNILYSSILFSFNYGFK